MIMFLAITSTSNTCNTEGKLFEQISLKFIKWIGDKFFQLTIFLTMHVDSSHLENKELGQ